MTTGCAEPKERIYQMPLSPGGRFKAEARVVDEGAALHIAEREQPWDGYDWLALGQCSNAAFYWTDEKHAVLAYDTAELHYFVDDPDNWGGAHLSLCNKSERACPAAASAIKVVPGCDDHSM